MKEWSQGRKEERESEIDAVGTAAKDYCEQLDQFFEDPIKFHASDRALNMRAFQAFRWI